MQGGSALVHRKPTCPQQHRLGVPSRPSLLTTADLVPHPPRSHPPDLMTPSRDPTHTMLSVMGTMQSMDSALRAKRSLAAPKPSQLKR